MISMEVWKFGGLHIVCDDDKFGGLRFGGLHVVCGDDKFGSLEVWKFTCCVMMMISLEVWKFGRLHIVCDDDRVGSLKV